MFAALLPPRLLPSLGSMLDLPLEARVGLIEVSGLQGEGGGLVVLNAQASELDGYWKVR